MISTTGAESELASPSRPHPTRTQWSLLLGVVALGAFLRMLNYGARAPWLDEYGTWWAVAGESYADVWSRSVAVHGQSPLFYLLVRLPVELCGASTWSLRFVPLLCGLAMLVVGYRLAFALFKERWMAITAVLVMAVDERMIYYSQDARPYSLGLLCAMLSMDRYIAVFRGGGRGARCGWAVATALTWYAHYVMGLVVAIQVIHIVWMRKRSQLSLQGWAILGGITALLMAPGLFQVATLFGRRESLDWIVDPDKTILVNDAIEFLSPRALALATVLGALLAVTRGAHSRVRGVIGPRLVALWYIGPFLACAVLPRLFGVSLVETRYVILSAPAALFFIALVLTGFRTAGSLGALPAVVFASASFFGTLLPFYQSDDAGVFSHLRGSRWQEMAAVVTEEMQPNDVILYSTGFVELDSIVAGEASPEVVSFAEFPLVANLGKAAVLPRIPLPYGRPKGLRAMNRQLAKTQHHDRIWVVGWDSAVRWFVELAEQLPEYTIVRRETFGQMTVIRVERR